MSTLRLADNGPASNNWVTQSSHLAEKAPEELYLWVPKNLEGTKGIWVREDYFDHLPEDQWEAVMERLAPYQERFMSGIFSNIRENIAARRERRQERREARQERSLNRIESGGIFGGALTNFVQGVFGGGQQEPVDQMPTRGLDVNVGYQSQTFWDKNKGWLLPVIIGGGALGTIAIIRASKKK